MKFPVVLICLLALGCASARSALVNRWSFDNPAGNAPAGTALMESVSGAEARVRGVNATFTGTALTIGGTTSGNRPASTISGYVDLPNALLSSKTSVTVEAWVTPLAGRAWMRVWDFGRTTATAGVGVGAVAGEISGEPATPAPGATSASDNLFLSFCLGGGSLTEQRLEALLNGGSRMTVDAALPTAAGQQYHYVMTFQGGVGPYPGGGMVTWYRDGLVVETGAVAFNLASIQDVNNWLGRSQWGADRTTNAAYDEFRIYDHALSAAEIAASLAAGPGTLAGPVTPPPLAPAQPVHRWSFNNPAGAATAGTTFTDAIGGAVAALRGNGATLTGTALTLPGTTNGNQTAAAISAYVDLPNGIISSKANLSVEAWATTISSKNQQRLFDFGRSTATFGVGAAMGEIIEGGTAPPAFNGYDNLVLSLNAGTTLGSYRLEGQIDGGEALYDDTNLSAVTSAGTEYHYVLTVEDGAGIYGATGCLAKWYRNGVLHDVLNLPYRLPEMSDVNNWIGRSQYGADLNANLALNELRIYASALTPAEIALSYASGNSASFGPPVTQPDAATIHSGQKVRIPVLANDTGSFNPATVQIVAPPVAGTATPDAAGRILYTHAGSSAAPVTFTYRVFGSSGYSAPATVTIHFSNVLRIANSALNVPAAPPATAIQVVNAFPNLTFVQPICFATIPGNTQRLFVCERLAKIRVIPNVTAPSPTSELFLDLQAMLVGRSPAETIEGGGNNEHGLLGLAFHPNYATNGTFYAAYTVRISGGSYYQRISRFQVSAGNPHQADPASELILLQQLDEGSNHDGGDLHFGPDGYLYYSAGDELAQRDILRNSQKIDLDFFSGIFRLDVDKKPGNLAPNPHPAIPTDNGVARFSVPADNPFIHTTSGGTWNGNINGVAISDLSKVRTEFWAFGLRHPWRFSFDAMTGQMWAGDVGQDTYEEINLIQKGGNYGWVYREGAHDTAFTNPVPIPPTKSDFPAFSSIDPVYEYGHGNGTFQGNSVVGGYVYRGSQFPWNGHYVFCDSVSGHIWKRDPGTGAVIRLTGVAAAYGGLATMGVDPSNQELLFADYLNGRILRLANETLTSSFPATLTETGLFADLTDLAPSPGLLPYAPNLTFWSDHAVKRRWFTIPNGLDRITWSRDGVWTFPAGQIWVKHFDLPLTRSHPPSPSDPPTPAKRIETRVLVRNSTGVYGVSYKWNDAQTEATLAADGGENFPVNVIVNGQPYAQPWSIPSRTQCLTCHTPQAGHALSFNTRQLNLVNSIHGSAGNQIDLLRNAGYFSNTPEASNVLPRHLRPEETNYPLEARVRSYLAVNCAYCHMAGGTGPSWDGRPELTLNQTGLLNGPAIGALHSADRLVAVGTPNDDLHSIVLSRVAGTGGYTRMPPLGSNELDHTNIALLTEWIGGSALQNRQTYDQWRLAQFLSGTSPQGEPNADADGDGHSNRDEFLAQTGPRNGAQFLQPLLTAADANLTFGFTVPANRSWQIETSTDLAAWNFWNVPGNSGLPAAGGPVSLSAPRTTAQQFFRLRFWEN